MSVPNQTPYNTHIGNGVSTVFAYEFLILSVDDMQVSINGQVLTSGYSVTGAGNTAGGTIVFLTPPANGATVLLLREVPLHRLTNYQDNGDLLADTLNKDFDRIWMVLQGKNLIDSLTLRRPWFNYDYYQGNGYRIADIANPVDDQDAATKKFVMDQGTLNLNRTLRVPETSVPQIPAVSLRRNKLLGFNDSGSPIAVLPASGSASDVLIELAKPTGAGLIGAGDTTVDTLLVRYSPLRYGAIADGITDDSLAFAACVAAAPEGATIDLQGGSYVGEMILTKSRVHVTNGTIKAPYNATKGCVVADGLEGVRVSYLNTFVDKANKALYSAPNVSGVHFENCQNVSVDHVFADGSKNDDYLLTGSWGCPIHAYLSSGVTISFCRANNADKEGIMTRLSDDVWITNCTSINAGYSCIGTSGGDRATISRCRAAASGATALTMNSQSSIVSNNTVDAGGAYNGILIGHDHETQAYGIDCMISHNLVKNCTGSGVSVSKGQHVVIDANIITNVTEDGVHVHSMTGNSINLLAVVISNNIVTNAGRSGIWCYESNPSLNTSYTIESNQLDGCGLYGVRINANRDILIAKNTLRAITDIAFFIRPSDNSVSGSCDSISISNNILIGSTGSAITTTPAKMVSVRDNNFYGFNSSGGAFSTAISIQGSISGVNYNLPNETIITGNIIEGTVGASTATVNISTDNGTGADRQLQIVGNLIRNSGNLLIYPLARYKIPQVRNNTKGLDECLISVSVPASGSVTVTNSNQTPYGTPKISARNTAGLGVYLSSIGEGTLTLNNSSASSASVSIEW